MAALACDRVTKVICARVVVPRALRGTTADTASARISDGARVAIVARPILVGGDEAARAIQSAEGLGAGIVVIRALEQIALALAIDAAIVAGAWIAVIARQVVVHFAADAIRANTSDAGVSDVAEGVALALALDTHITRGAAVPIVARHVAKAGHDLALAGDTHVPQAWVLRNRAHQRRARSTGTRSITEVALGAKHAVFARRQLVGVLPHALALLAHVLDALVVLVGVAHNVLALADATAAHIILSTGIAIITRDVVSHNLGYALVIRSTTVVARTRVVISGEALGNGATKTDALGGTLVTRSTVEAIVTRDLHELAFLAANLVLGLVLQVWLALLIRGKEAVLADGVAGARCLVQVFPRLAHHGAFRTVRASPWLEALACAHADCLVGVESAVLAAVLFDETILATFRVLIERGAMAGTVASQELRCIGRQGDTRAWQGFSAGGVQPALIAKVTKHVLVALASASGLPIDLHLVEEAVLAAIDIFGVALIAELAAE